MSNLTSLKALLLKILDRDNFTEMKYHHEIFRRDVFLSSIKDFITFPSSEIVEVLISEINSPSPLPTNQDFLSEYLETLGIIFDSMYLLLHYPNSIMAKLLKGVFASDDTIFEKLMRITFLKNSGVEKLEKAILEKLTSLIDEAEITIKKESPPYSTTFWGQFELIPLSFLFNTKHGHIFKEMVNQLLKLNFHLIPPSSIYSVLNFVPLSYGGSLFASEKFLEDILQEEFRQTVHYWEIVKEVSLIEIKLLGFERLGYPLPLLGTTNLIEELITLSKMSFSGFLKQSGFADKGYDINYLSKIHYSIITNAVDLLSILTNKPLQLSQYGRTIYFLHEITDYELDKKLLDAFINWFHSIKDRLQYNPEKQLYYVEGEEIPPTLS